MRSAVSRRRRRARWLLALAAVVAAAGCDGGDDGRLWSVRRGHVGEFAAGGDDVVTVGDELAVYHATTGRRVRATALPADLGNPTTGQLGPEVALAATAVVFGWYDFEAEIGTLFCFDRGSLARRWQWQIRWPWRQRTLRPSLAVAVDDRQVYAAAIGKDEDNLFAFRLEDGVLAWSRSVEKFPAESGLALHGQQLIVRSQLWARTSDWHEQLDAIRTGDGQRLWRTWLTGESSHHRDRPLIADGHLYTTTRDGPHAGRLFSVRLSDGSTSRVDVDTSGAAFAKHGAVVYLGGSPPLAHDLRSARTLWRAALGGEGDRVPLVAGGARDAERRRLYVGDSQRFLYVLDQDSGRLDRRIRLDRYWRFELNPLKAMYAAHGVRRIQAHGDAVLVGTADGSLFVFRPPR